MTSLTEHTMAIAEILKARGETVAVAETSAGGLVSAQLLAVPGASAYFVGGGVLYTGDAREGLAGITEADITGMRSSSEPYAELLGQNHARETGHHLGSGGNRGGRTIGKSLWRQRRPHMRRCFGTDFDGANTGNRGR